MAGCPVFIVDGFGATPKRKAARGVGLRFVFPLLTGLCAAQPVFGFGYIYERDLFQAPSLPNKNPVKYKNYISCYDIDTRQLLNCALTYRAIGIKDPRTSPDNNGGHNHGFDTHPVIQPANGALQFSGTDTDPSPLGVRGQTQNSEVLITHPMPQVAGKIIVEETLTAPPGRRCAGGCFTFNSQKRKNTIDVRIPGLTRLPTSTAFHITARGGTASHPEGTWGTLNTVGRAVYLASEYFKITGRRLSINDLSLPKGGVFDIDSNWTKPHASHRTGTDMDLNRADEGGVTVNCEDDDALDKAIKEAHRQLPPVKRYCENKGRKHVDFD